MLQIYHSYHFARAQNRRAENRLKVILRQVAEDHEPRIIPCTGSNRHRLAMFSYPSRDALSDLNAKMFDEVCMGIFRRPQDEFLLLQYIDKAGVTRNDCRDEIDDAAQDNMEGVSPGKPAAYLV